MPHPMTRRRMIQLSRCNGPLPGVTYCFRPGYPRDITERYVLAYLASMEAADIQVDRLRQPILSAHFPVGRFPELYPEHDDRPFHEEPHMKHTADTTPPGFRRSRFALPLKRASWVSCARTKPSMSDYLVGA